MNMYIFLAYGISMIIMLTLALVTIMEYSKSEQDAQERKK